MRRGSLRYILMIVSLSLIAAAVFLRPLSHVMADLARYSPAIEEGSGAVQQVFRSSASGSDPTSSIVMRTRLDLSYPKEMREHQTGTVSLKYSMFDEQPGPDGTETIKVPWPRLPLSTGAALNSSGFDIAPSQFIKKEPATPLPVEFVWMLTPRGEGDHLLVLDVSLLTSSWQVLVAVQAGLMPQSLSLTLNEQPSALSPGGVVELPVRVSTIWGVPSTTMELVRAAIGLAGFVLLYPIFVGRMKARAQARSAGA